MVSFTIRISSRIPILQLKIISSFKFFLFKVFFEEWLIQHVFTKSNTQYNEYSESILKEESEIGPKRVYAVHKYCVFHVSYEYYVKQPKIGYHSFPTMIVFLSSPNECNSHVEFNFHFFVMPCVKCEKTGSVCIIIIIKIIKWMKMKRWRKNTHTIQKS